MSVSDTYTAVIADDHDIVRDGLRAALEQSDLFELLTLNIVAETSNGFETLAAVKQHQPDLLLLDLTMPLSGGAEVYTDVRRWSPKTKIVVYSSVTAPGVLSMLVSAGVDGMFAKGGSNKLLYEKLPLILRGGRFIAPECMALMEGQEDVVALTAREHQTLHLVLSGKTTKEIAAAQGISPRTVEKHRASLMQKLDVSSIAELMAKALKDGLLDSSSSI
ncbi:MAG: response regulator transcription factor [Hyphomonadaceae bacterium]|nr:response regulator transcription factor [Hyphomonadaceae bacterium]